MDPAQSENGHGKGSSTHFAPKSILFVDDEPDVRTAYKRLLERRIPGVRVWACESGPAALEVLQREAIDLIVADYRMPGMNGIELLYEVQRMKPQLPRILFTAYGDADFARRAAEEAAVSLFLSKDVSPERLAALVGIYLSAPPAGA